MLPGLWGSDIELTFHHDAAKSWILSAPTQIEQVIANLAINARDAMPEGGRLEIAMSLSCRKRARMSLHFQEIGLSSK